MNAVAEMTVLEAITETVSSTLKIPASRLDVDAGFESFGMDSIIAMELMTNLSKKLQISITPAQLTSVSSIRELAAMIESAMNASAPAAAPKPQAAQATPVAPVAQSTAKASAGRAKQSAAPARHRPVSSLSGAGSLKQILQFIKSRFDLDLNGLRFASKEVLIDYLVEHHAETLSRHYGLFADDEEESRDETGVPRGLAVPLAAPERGKDVAIVGMACQFADAKTPNALWQNLLDGRSSIKPLAADRWQQQQGAEAAGAKCWGALLEDVDRFDPAFFDLSEQEAPLIDPQERLVMQALYHALQNAGIRADTLRGSRTALFLGYEFAEYEHYLRKNLHRLPGAPAFSSSSPIYYLANRISFLFDFKGPSEVVNASCAASALAIHRACQSLAQGECDVAICGGVSLNLFAEDYAAIAHYGLLSADGSCAVFDDKANGFTRGEGVGLLVLKRLQDAERDNNRIFAKVIATYQNNRGRASFMSQIKHEALTEVIRECYEKHEVAASSVHYIEVDGYSTKWGDSFEFEGIKNAFQSAADGGKHTALGSIKGNIGHVEPASGVASAIKLALSLHHGQFPATITKKRLSSFIDVSSKSHPLYIADRPLPFAQLRRQNEAIRAGINSFADSGVNVHLLLEEYRPERAAPRSGTRGPQLLIFSARTPESLLQYLDSYPEYLQQSALESGLEDLAYTLQTGTEPMEHRVAIIASSRAELTQLLARARKLLAEHKPADGKGPVFIDNVPRRDSRRLLDVIKAQIKEDKLLENLQRGQFDEIALLWTSGIDIPWNAYWRELTLARRERAEALPQIIDIPPYPFAKKRYWLDFDAVPVSAFISPLSQGEPQVTREQAKASPGESPRAWTFTKELHGAGQRESLDAQEKIRLFVLQETACLLRIAHESVDTGQNFLRLGFDSVGMATLIQRLTELLNENISPSVVFKYQNIDALSRYLAATYRDKIDPIQVVGSPTTETRASKPRAKCEKSDLETWFVTYESAGDSRIVPMQTSATGTPILTVPGVDGSVLSLQTLSRELEGVRPMFAFEAVGRDGKSEPLDTVRAMAEANIEALAAMRDSSRLSLLGHSNGAFVAFEMARQLLEQGRTVERLVLVDCLSPRTPVRDQTDEIAAAFALLIRALGGEHQLDVAEFNKVLEADQADYLRDLMKRNGFDTPREQFLQTYRLALANEKACRSYRPGKIQLPCATVVVRATQNNGAAPADLGWNEWLAEPATCVAIDADHLSIVGKEGSAQIAQLFK